MSPALGQDKASTIDLTILNAATPVHKDAFTGVQNLIVPGPPRVLLDRITAHIKRSCYKVLSLTISGPDVAEYRATCFAVISTSLPRVELRRMGFEWHGLPDETLQKEVTSSQEQHSFDASTKKIRMDFVNGHWNSSYTLIRGALHSSTLERALVIVDEHIKAGCYRLEALSAIKDWCTITIDTNLTREELRGKGFVWHALGGEADENGAIVIPGYDRSDEHWEDDDGVIHHEAIDMRDL